METTHRVLVGDSREMSRIESDSVDLVVTSPPYPMIEMWDESFAAADPRIRAELADGNGPTAFELMHEQLDEVWAEVGRVLVEGGIACVNVGDATRTVDGTFRVYQNHARIGSAFEALGFEPLPDLVWRKPVNSGAKFMGSGMLPPNAYVTLEHEYVLVFRNGTAPRSFEPSADRRYRSAYFWEERNRWFSDLWTDVNGTGQALGDTDVRSRSGAYPFEIPYRLVNMYSVYGDTVLDPFWGTGTTTLAAMSAARNSVGHEIEPAFARAFDERVDDVAELSRAAVSERLRDHEAFVDRRRSDGEEFTYEAENYEFPVTTKQEVPIQLYDVATVRSTERPRDSDREYEYEYVVAHETH
jgi:DNA modification methylase